MPIYEYRCTDCDNLFEVLVRPSENGTECPACHGSNLSRELSVFATGRAEAASAAPARGCGGGGCCGSRCACG
jgi:putative FmdB family regulatory protein